MLTGLSLCFIWKNFLTSWQPGCLSHPAVHPSLAGPVSLPALQLPSPTQGERNRAVTLRAKQRQNGEKDKSRAC